MSTTCVVAGEMPERDWNPPLCDADTAVHVLITSYAYYLRAHREPT